LRPKSLRGHGRGWRGYRGQRAQELLQLASVDRAESIDEPARELPGAGHAVPISHCLRVRAGGLTTYRALGDGLTKPAG